MMDKEVETLESHSIMLGQIASEVEEWCPHEETTTLDAVRLLKAEYMLLKYGKIKEELEKC